MQESNKKGLMIFGAAVLIILFVCLIAYAITGNQGIEQRFKNAVGLGGGPEVGGGGGFLGFDIEGNLLSYLVILVILIGVSVFAYLKFGRKPREPRQ